MADNIERSLSINRLGDIAEEQRRIATAKNIYNVNDTYNLNHPNATTEQGGVDDPFNVKGKNILGTPEFDVYSNFGSSVDREARMRAIVQNPYSANNPFPTTPPDLGFNYGG